MGKVKVVLLPHDKTVEIDQEKTLLEGLREQGIPIKSSCGGVASCSDCMIKVKGREENLTRPTFGEIKLLGNVFHITKERLSCQTKANGEVILDISNHLKFGDELTRNMNVVRKSHKTLLKKPSDKIAERQEEIPKKTYQEEKKDDSGGRKRPRRFKYLKKKSFKK